MKKILSVIERMKKMAKNLTDITFPNCQIGEDQDLILLKSSEILVDGYETIIYFSISDYSNYKIKTLQICPKNHYFLPFNLSCKLAKKFLGKRYVSLLELFSGAKKIHCWSLVVNKKEEPIENPYETNSELQTFENFNFYLMKSDEINFL
jgi:hypothetical protein